MARIGRHRQEMRLQTDTPTRDAAGGEVASWADTVATWYCELIQVKGGEIFRGRAVHAQANHIAVGRYVSGVNTRMRGAMGAGATPARTFEIVDVIDVDNRGIELRLELKERGL